ncbi:hypothetical protein ACFVMC_11600 [Nocardia sp. NPDC127579]|uniref:hypothetical protein n=1 Tax=Nocardia sp. NPDC127579 TaxID=3345402 RepID=UPI00363E8049
MIGRTMRVHAYPTDAAVPVALAEAERIAATHLSDPGDSTAGVENVVTEFDSCFTVVPVTPTPADRTAPPPLAPVSVIDKATGAISFWPAYPVALVAEQYAATDLVIEDDWPGAADS